MVNQNFYKRKRVLVTGHTGFKGTWLCKILTELGAEVAGYALEPDKPSSLFETSNISEKIVSVFGDIRDMDLLKKTVEEFNPEIIFHLAAQPIVRESYKNPAETYEVNVMGTVNLLECARKTGTVKSIVNVTTDKVYENMEWERGYAENDILNGNDPYSNSKSCSELVTSCYVKSYFNQMNIACSTMRSGNVIGGGDYSADRILPDCVRHTMNKEVIQIRNPQSVRPYQHVLEPLFAYLLLAEEQYSNRKVIGSYNIGPTELDTINTKELVEKFCYYWGEGASWQCGENEGPKESNVLRLNTEKFCSAFHWKPVWNIDKAVEKTVEFYKLMLLGSDMELIMKQQIQDYMSEWI